MSLCSVAIVAGCSGATGRNADVHARLAAIAAQCRLPAGAFELRSPEELHFKPPEDARYEDVACAIAALRRAKLPLSFAYVGHESYTTGNIQ